MRSSPGRRGRPGARRRRGDELGEGVAGLLHPIVRGPLKRLSGALHRVFGAKRVLFGGWAVRGGARRGLGAPAIFALPSVSDVFAPALPGIFPGGVHLLGPGAGAGGDAGGVRLVLARRGQLIGGAGVSLGGCGAHREVLGAAWVGERGALAELHQPPGLWFWGLWGRSVYEGVLYELGLKARRQQRFERRRGLG